MFRSLVLGAVAALVVLASPAAASAAPQYYVSLGDSYASGYQPGAKGGGTRNGFAYQLPALAKKRGYALELVNFGCGGATSSSILNEKLKPGAKCLGPGAPRFSSTQVAAATAFIREHRDRIGLVTVSIGGNDITGCAREADAVSCIGTSLPKLQANLKTLLQRLRAAGGAKMRITGITYPDVLLGGWVGENPNQELAKLSVVGFKSLINPALQKTYTAAKAKFVDVTTATGAYTPLEQTTELAPYGTVPVAVAKACELTYYCEQRDIHPRTAGYRIIAELVARTLPRRG